MTLTIVESLNSTFVHALSGRYEGLMPEMSALARRLTRIDGFRNTSAPTIAALMTMLCSLHPPTHPHELRVGETTDGVPRTPV